LRRHPPGWQFLFEVLLDVDGVARRRYGEISSAIRNSNIFQLVHHCICRTLFAQKMTSFFTTEKNIFFSHILTNHISSYMSLV
jgi:hypothetical protein